MNKEAQAIQDQIDELKNKRDALRGNYMVICGGCYHDKHETFEEHQRYSPHCDERYGQPSLGIYDSEWIKEEDGRWNRLLR